MALLLAAVIWQGIPGGSLKIVSVGAYYLGRAVATLLSV